MTVKLELCPSYENYRSYDYMRDVEKFSVRSRTIECLDDRVTDESILYIQMQSKSLRFYVMQKGFEIGDDPVIEFQLKLHDIAEDARNYIAVCQNDCNPRFDENKYEKGRSEIHDILATKIDDILSENGISERTSVEPSNLSTRIITSWFRQIAYCEKVDKKLANEFIGSFGVFYDSPRRNEFGMGLSL